MDQERITDDDAMLIIFDAQKKIEYYGNCMYSCNPATKLLTVIKDSGSRRKATFDAFFFQKDNFLCVESYTHGTSNFVMVFKTSETCTAVMKTIMDAIAKKPKKGTQDDEWFKKSIFVPIVRGSGGHPGLKSEILRFLKPLPDKIFKEYTLLYWESREGLQSVAAEQVLNDSFVDPSQPMPPVSLPVNNNALVIEVKKETHMDITTTARSDVPAIVHPIPSELLPVTENARVVEVKRETGMTARSDVPAFAGSHGVAVGSIIAATPTNLDVGTPLAAAQAYVPGPQPCNPELNGTMQRHGSIGEHINPPLPSAIKKEEAHDDMDDSNISEVKPIVPLAANPDFDIPLDVPQAPVPQPDLNGTIVLDETITEDHHNADRLNVAGMNNDSNGDEIKPRAAQQPSAIVPESSVHNDESLAANKRGGNRKRRAVSRFHPDYYYSPPTIKHTTRRHHFAGSYSELSDVQKDCRRPGRKRKANYESDQSDFFYSDIEEPVARASKSTKPRVIKDVRELPAQLYHVLKSFKKVLKDRDIKGINYYEFIMDPAFDASVANAAYVNLLITGQHMFFENEHLYLRKPSKNAPAIPPPLPDYNKWLEHVGDEALIQPQ